MPFDPKRHHRRSIRLRDYDYRNAGAYFITIVAKRINKRRGTPGYPVLQRNYHEHIIRDEDELNRIRFYIVNNPAQWDSDIENPGRK